RQGAFAAARAEETLRAAGVVAGNDRGIEDFFKGVAARLAGLPLDEIEHFVLTLEQQIVEAEEDARAVRESAAVPGELRGAGALRSEVEIGGASGGDIAEDGAGEGRANGDGSVRAVRQGD